MNLLITGARVIDPSQELDATLDILIEDGVAVRMAVLYLLGGAHVSE